MMESQAVGAAILFLLDQQPDFLILVRTGKQNSGALYLGPFSALRHRFFRSFRLYVLVFGAGTSSLNVFDTPSGYAGIIGTDGLLYSEERHEGECHRRND